MLSSSITNLQEEANGVNKRLTHFNFTFSFNCFFSWLGIDKIKFQRYQRLIEIAEEKVRIAYQTLQRQALNNLAKQLVGE